MNPFRSTEELRVKLTLIFTQVAVTATAKEFAGIYRGKQCHPPDFVNSLGRAREAGVKKVILTGMSISDVGRNTEVAQSQPAGSCFLTIGVHPYHAGEMIGEDQVFSLKQVEQAVDEAFSRSPRLIAAFGELGLDYDRLQLADKETQIAAFKAQLDLFVAKNWQLPLFLHCRAACDDFLDIMKPYVSKLPKGGLVHSFVGTKTEMEKIIELGLDVSVNGFSFANTASIEMAAAVPLNKLHIETDAPWGEIKANSELAKAYLVNTTPLPASKKKDKWEASCMVKERNESCTMEKVAFVVAGLKGIAVDEVSEAAWRNSCKMFGLGD